MVKSTKRPNNKGKTGKTSAKQPGAKRLVIGAPNSNLRKWITLLGDPCNAELAAPCYGGSGTGYYIRQSQVLTPPATAQDYLLEFTPASNNDTMFRYGWTDTPGSPFNNAGWIPLYGLMSNNMVARKRCIAACIQVQYKGSELNRSGLVSAICIPGSELVGGEVITGNSSDWSTTMSHNCRVGEGYEYLWVPGEGDQEWLANTYGDPKAANPTLGNSLQILLRNIPPGTVELRCTSCWEWLPAQEGQEKAWCSAPAKAPPSVPFQTAMASIGDMAKFMVRRVGERAVPLLASMATQAIRNVPPALMYLA